MPEHYQPHHIKIRIKRRKHNIEEQYIIKITDEEYEQLKRRSSWQ